MTQDDARRIYEAQVARQGKAQQAPTIDARQNAQLFDQLSEQYQRQQFGPRTTNVPGVGAMVRLRQETPPLIDGPSTFEDTLVGHDRQEDRDFRRQAMSDIVDQMARAGVTHADESLGEPWTFMRSRDGNPIGATDVTPRMLMRTKLMTEQLRRQNERDAPLMAHYQQLQDEALASALIPRPSTPRFQFIPSDPRWMRGTPEWRGR